MTRTRRGAIRRFAVALVCAVALVSAPAAAWADDVEMAKSAGVGLGSAVASLLYAPAKTAYAFGGLMVGGLAFLFSGGDADVARVVLEPSVMGDYVITTQHLSGERKIEFFGRQATPEERYEARDRDVASAPDDW
jgi:hypothetical protein